MGVTVLLLLLLIPSSLLVLLMGRSEAVRQQLMASLAAYVGFAWGVAIAVGFDYAMSVLYGHSWLFG